MRVYVTKSCYCNGKLQSTEQQQILWRRENKINHRQQQNLMNNDMLIDCGGERTSEITGTCVVD